MTTKPMSDAELKKQFYEDRKSGYALSTLIDDLIASAKAEGGREVLKDVDIDNTISILEDLEPQIKGVLRISDIKWLIEHFKELKQKFQKE